MQVLLVYAHPEPRSFCAALKDSAVAHWQAAGHQVQVSDLYAMGWNPVASAADFATREDADYLTYALEQRHALREASLAADIRAELDKLLWADLLVLCFPLYWGSVPAILKGWIDRVLVSGVCYGGKRFYDHGGLQGKRALVCLTLGGQAHMFADEQAIHGDLHTLLRPLLRGTLAYVGMQVLPPFAAYHVPYLAAPARQALLADWQRYLDNLEQQACLPMPHLAAFDAQLNPLPR